MNRLLVGLLALVLASCATLVRGDRATLVLRDAPRDLVVLEEGRPVPVEASGRDLKASIGWKTEQVTLRSGGAQATAPVESSLGIGYFIADYLLGVFPIFIDLYTGKWRSHDDINVPRVLGTPPPAPVAASSRPAAAPARQEPAPVVQEAPRRAVQEVQRAAQVETGSAPAARGPRTPVVRTGKLAVLDFKSFTKELQAEQVRYFTDVVRDATVKTSPEVHVMTRENLLVLLQATGKDAANCEGECEVDTGRRIGADAVVSGEILKVGSRYKLSLKLHETKEGRLLSTAVASGKSIDELDEAAQVAAADLIAPNAR